jgi:thiosulfate dehydrogenase [quinone] large subunit
MAKAFQITILPLPLVRLFAFALPFIEMVVGLLVLLGLFTRSSLLAGGMLIVVLMFGTALQGKWDTLTQQLIYAALYAALLANAQWNHLALDSWLAWRRSKTPR